MATVYEPLPGNPGRTLHSMTTQAFDDSKHPRSGDGTFSTVHHPEGTVALAAPPAFDAEDVAKGILTDLRDIPAKWTSELYYDSHNAARAGKVSYPKFLDGLIAKNRNGRCERHEHVSDHSPERYCNECHVAFMVEARTNPKPLPVPRGVIPVRQQSHHLTSEQLNRDYDRGTKVEVTTSKKTGDEKFESAVRRMFNAPAGAPVEVIEEETEAGTDWTRESTSEITVKCDGREAVYDHMGSFMRALDRVDQDPQATALRWSGEQPQLNGIAAVYVYNGDADPQPVFGKIRDVFTDDDIDACMDFLHLDGRQEYLEFDQVVSILETDQSSEYDVSE
jgi:hypothetical protein